MKKYQDIILPAVIARKKGELLNNDEIRVERKLRLIQNRYCEHFWVWNKTADKNAISEFTKSYKWDKKSF